MAALEIIRDNREEMMPLLVPMEAAADNPIRCPLDLILEYQGKEKAKQVLTSPGQPGEALREHIPTCDHCSVIVRELYSNGEIPVSE